LWLSRHRRERFELPRAREIQEQETEALAEHEAWEQKGEAVAGQRRQVAG
jgi:hypothetical protein